MKVLITGGAGLIGSHIADEYLRRGADVWVVDDLYTGKKSNLHSDVRFVEIRTQDPALSNVFREAGGFDVVSHHAARISVRRSVDEPLGDASTNIEGLLNVVENAVHFGCRRFIFASSGGVVYGPAEVIPTPENTPKRPLSPYGVAKLSGELYLHYYQRIHGLDYVALRYANVYGPRQDPHGETGVVAIFWERLLADQPLTIFGDGTQTRDYIHVHDVLRAHMIAAEMQVAGGTELDDFAFNVGTGVETSLNEVTEMLLEIARRRVPVQHAPARRGELARNCLDTTKLQARGWRAEYELRAGLEQTLTADTTNG